MVLLPVRPVLWLDSTGLNPPNTRLSAAIGRSNRTNRQRPENVGCCATNFPSHVLHGFPLISSSSTSGALNPGHIFPDLLGGPCPLTKTTSVGSEVKWVGRVPFLVDPHLPRNAVRGSDFEAGRYPTATSPIPLPAIQANRNLSLCSQHHWAHFCHIPT